MCGGGGGGEKTKSRQAMPGIMNVGVIVWVSGVRKRGCYGVGA